MQKLSSPIDLIKKAITIFSKKENFLFFAKIYILLVPFAILSVLQSYLVKPESPLSSNPGFTSIVIALNIIYALVYVFVSVSGILAVKSVVDGDKLSFKSAFKNGWKIYWKYLLLTIVVVATVGFGFVLLIVPGVIFMTWYSFAKFVLIQNDKIGTLTALKRSKELVKGKFWAVFGRLLVFGFFSFAIGLVTGLAPYGVGGVVSVFFEALLILPSYLLYKELSA